MLRTLTLARPSVIAATSSLLARGPRVLKSNGTNKSDGAGGSDSVTGEEEQAAESWVPDDPDAPVVEATHVRPQDILKDILSSVSAGQQTFLFGAQKDVVKGGDVPMHATGTFFESINSAYEGQMLQEQQREVANYVEKRRLHYAQRVEEETEEFRQEQREIHEEIQRFEGQKYKSDLTSDVVEFTQTRVTEYEGRLNADVEKYYNALLAYQSRMKKNASGKPTGKPLAMQLSSKLQAVIKEMELEEAISNFGDAPGSENDITDQDIRSYVVQRTCFYEQCAKDEAHDFTVNRRSFYEELLEARSIRHAAKIRSDTERFRKERQEYYDERLTNDGSWMAHCFQEHYNQCFLQSYARKAWIDHRRYQATQEGIKGIGKEGEHIPAISNPSTITISALNKEIPLTQILDIYESENIADVARDIFLKAARRVAAANDSNNDG